MLEKIHFPNKEIEIENGIVIIGANGSGKTRLGSWINLQSPHKNNSYRITAQKSLNFNKKIQQIIVDTEAALNTLLYNTINVDYSDKRNKTQQKRTSGDPSTSFIQDYDKLLSYLFSEHGRSLADYRKKSDEGSKKVPIEPTKIEQVKKIWEEIIPHLTLEIGSGGVKTNPKNTDGSTYYSSEMSDGKRTIFYLIGYCLVVPENCIIIVDEPELHLHKSIRDILWNKIENARRNCKFVYLTHDMEFSASRVGFKKILVKKYKKENGKEDWDFVEIDNGYNRVLMCSNFPNPDIQDKKTIYLKKTTNSIQYLSQKGKTKSLPFENWPEIIKNSAKDSEFQDNEVLKAVTSLCDYTLDNSNEVPDELLFELLGNRKKALLVEGDNDSYDVKLYKNIFTDFLIKPCGGCGNVIEYTKSLRNNKRFHHIEVFGLIDRDRRSEEEIKSLKNSNVFCLNIAEIENLFVTPEILELVSKTLKKKDDEHNAIFEKSISHIFKNLSKELEKQVSEHAAKEIKFMLERCDFSPTTKNDYDKHNEILKKIDPEKIYESINNRFLKILEERNYKELLVYYNRKSLSSEISKNFDIKDGSLPEHIIKTSRNSEHLIQLRKAVMKYLPKELVNLIENRLESGE